MYRELSLVNHGPIVIYRFSLARLPNRWGRGQVRAGDHLVFYPPSMEKTFHKSLIYIQSTSETRILIPLIFPADTGHPSLLVLAIGPARKFCPRGVAKYRGVLVGLGEGGDVVAGEGSDVVAGDSLLTFCLSLCIAYSYLYNCPSNRCACVSSAVFSICMNARCCSR